jgi:hypothetical protein
MMRRHVHLVARPKGIQKNLTSQLTVTMFIALGSIDVSNVFGTLPSTRDPQLQFGVNEAGMHDATR